MKEAIVYPATLVVHIQATFVTSNIEDFCICTYNTAGTVSLVMLTTIITRGPGECIKIIM